MAIGGSLSINTNTPTPATDTKQAQFKQRKQDFDNLKKALDSGDLKGAQDAFAKVQADAPQGKKAPQGGASGSQDPLSSLASALSSGNLSAAQSAFSSIQQTMQAHHAQHHQAKNDNDADDAASAQAMVATATGTGTTVDTSA